jgi:taurine dioxygenase
MASIKERPLTDDLPFGARVGGIGAQALEDPAVREQIRDIFQRRGLIIFEDMDASTPMQLSLSNVFGPLQDHAFKGSPRLDQKALPGVIDLNLHPSDADIYEVNGRRLSGWLPWHFDACYTKELNRGGVLRALEIPPQGGMTGFADGVQLYEAISPQLRERFQHQNVVYAASLVLMRQRFGMPASFRAIRLNESTMKLIEQNAAAPRAVHPAIWKRDSGEHVLHVSPWQAAGLEGYENPEGDALLESLCQEMYRKMTPYFHSWKYTDVLVWDNWRFVHSVNGHSPEHARRVHRTTIKGDYGLGYFEATPPVQSRGTHG